MKMPRLKSPGFASLIAVAVASSFVLTSAGCKKPAMPVEKQKPVSIIVEVQVFSLPRALAAETVLSQPVQTDYAAARMRRRSMPW